MKYILILYILIIELFYAIILLFYCSMQSYIYIYIYIYQMYIYTFRRSFVLIKNLFLMNVLQIIINCMIKLYSLLHGLYLLSLI